MKKCVAVVGCGLWGRNIVRNFYNLNALHSVCDLDNENLKMINELYPDVNITKNFDELLSNPEITAMCIVTPSHTHFKIVKKALLAGKNVYVEKPISTSSEEAKELKELADKMDVKLLVGHLLLYHPAVNRLKMLIAEGVLGEIKYVQSDRLNINYFKNDRSVMWDLAPHDVSMIAHVTGKAPLKVLNAVGVASEFENICDITHLTIEFEDGVIGQVSDSWIHPQKRVTLLVRGTKATAILDDTLTEGKLKVYDNQKNSQKDIEIFDYLEIEPLKLECQHFLNCIENNKTPRSDGENGYMIVKILESAEKMMLGKNKEILDNHEFKLSRSK
ncbi:MAG: Gfo/Idh/MocA family oxidoreductase [Candidatus Gastranaerophilales bacterium]|nr:Gfo/Idh/MocA family oxidoreductase [Candidatus Gastranaerophilales bacterium]